MRQLWAASVAPQRIRLLHVMPPERSHILAAAGLHGASSARSIALAAVAVRPIKKHAATIVFMLGSIPHVYWKRPVYPLTARKSSIFVRRTTSPKLLTILTQIEPMLERAKVMSPHCHIWRHGLWLKRRFV